MDHLILALRRSGFTPYGLRAGVGGNWLHAALDAGLAAFLYLLHGRLEGRRA